MVVQNALILILALLQELAAFLSSQARYLNNHMQWSQKGGTGAITYPISPFPQLSGQCIVAKDRDTPIEQSWFITF